MNVCVVTLDVKDSIASTYRVQDLCCLLAFLNLCHID